ncbi:MAG: signal transduction histidine kinase [Rhodothermales bacterium]|jgi:signal transduction histidine kinase
MTAENRRLATRLLICLLIGLLTLGLRNSSALRALHLWTYDLAVRWQAGHTPTHPDIIVVEIDDKSLAELEDKVGRWPWPRSLHAAIIDYCSAARAIGVDILFVEPDNHYSGDETLAKAAKAHGHTWFAMQPQAGADTLRIDKDRLPPTDLDVASFETAIAPLPLLRDAGSIAAVLQAGDPEDGVLRHYGLAYNVAGELVPSFGLALAAEYLELPLDAIQLDHSGLSLAADRVSPVTATGALRISPSDELPIGVSAAAVLEAWTAESSGNTADLTREFFRDKIVLIGSTATGLHGDRLITSLGYPEPGILIHARAISNLLRRDSIGVFPPALALALTLSVGLLPALGLAQRPARMTIVAIASALVYAALLRGLMLQSRLVAPVLPLVAFSSGAVSMMVLNWYRERRRRHELEALEKVKQQFTDMLVHDLKNRAGPILVSLSFIDDILLDEDDDGEVRDMIRTALEATDRLLLEIRSLLDIRRIDEGKMQLTPSPQSAAGLLQAAIAEVQPPELRDSMELQLHNTGDASITVDPLIINRVLLNLLRNAADHREEGTPIIVSSELHDHACILAVANDCPAIPLEKQATLFDPFVSDSTGKKTLSGSGLGLAFCKLAVEAHNGEVNITSPRPGKAQGFLVEIRLTQPDK